MNGKSNLSWKAALVPAALVTAALAVGIGRFAGGSGESQAPSAAQDFKFDSGPKYAPGSSPLARTEQQSGSSIEMFRKVNENYSSETAAPEQPASRRKNLSKSELQEFMRQQRAALNFDPEALAAAAGEKAGEQQPQSRNIYNPARKGAPQEAAASAVSSRQPGQAPRLQTASASMGRRSAFGIGAQASMSRGGSGPGRQRGLEQGGESVTGEAGSYSGGGESGGRNLSAGEYGSHGGGQSAAQSGQSAQNPSSMAGGGEAPKEKRKPAPVAFVWPRSLDFGKMYNYETAARLVIVMNIGDAELRLGKIENMDDETPFYMEKDGCSGVKLTPKKSCAFRVRFSPKAAKEYYTGFSVGSNDSEAMDYQTYIEVKGESKYSYTTWWWMHNWHGDAGYSNRLEFSMVPEGYSMDEVLRVYNNSGQSWYRLKLDLSKLPGSFKVISDKCTGQELHPQQSCSLTVNFVPDSGTNRKFCPNGYGMYHSVDLDNGRKLLHSRPHFPPLVLDKPVEAYPKGEIRVLADYEEYYNHQQLVLSMPVSGVSCAPFPVYGLERVQHYFYFR